MPRLVVRKSYRCLPGKRRDLIAALQRVDAIAAAAGWPPGRYLLVETRSPGEPDIEVEFVFESLTEMEQLERRLREHLTRRSRDAAGAGAAGSSAGQEFLIEPSATRYLTLLDDGSRRPVREPASRAPAAPRASSKSAAPSSGDAPPAAPPDDEPPPGTGDEDFEEFEVEVPPAPFPDLAPEERRRRLLADARAALDRAESIANVSPERRASRRRPGGAPPAAGT